jgi:hypothetical protein
VLFCEGHEEFRQQYKPVFDVEEVGQSELGRRYSVWTADFRRQNREKENTCNRNM